MLEVDYCHLMRLPSVRTHPWLAAMLTILVGLAVGWILLDRWLEHYLESQSFRSAMSRLTCRVFKVSGEYAPIRRTGFLSVATPGFVGTNGWKMTRSIETQQVTATLNPWGLFLRRWQLQEIRIARGRIELQQQKPQPPPPRPWRLITTFLREVTADSADVLTRFRGQPGGFYDIKLRVCSHGEGFDYLGRDGQFRVPRLPQLKAQRVHVLVVPEKLYLHEAVLLPPRAPGSLHLKGEAGMRGDRRFKAELDSDQMPLAPWCGRWQGSVEGVIDGQVSCQGETQQQAKEKEPFSELEANGRFEAKNGRLHHLQFLDKLAEFTVNESLREL